MEKVDLTIIGAGVVGLSIASQVARKNRDVILIERHGGFGEEASSRNSEIVHAGIYYPPGSLKAKLCLEGNRLLYQICEENGIPYHRVGKLIVAVNEVEENVLEDLKENGRRNGVSDLRIISSKEVQRLEPHIKARAAILSPSSGIIDSHRLMKYFETTAKNNNASIVYGCEVKSIEKTTHGYRISTRDTDGEPFSFLTRILINSAGLCSDKITEMVGIDVVKSEYRLHYAKGEYVRVGGGKAKLVKRLIYPTPKETSLGIHTVTDLQGEMRLGPNAFYVDDINYDVDPEHVAEFYESVKPFLPFIAKEDLTPDMSGIRSKLQAAGEPAKDFIIVPEEEKGLPGFINLIGIDSPGLTASPAIGRLVESMVERIL